jgi:hypothetical protein
MARIGHNGAHEPQPMHRFLSIHRRGDEPEEIVFEEAVLENPTDAAPAAEPTIKLRRFILLFLPPFMIIDSIV